MIFRVDDCRFECSTRLGIPTAIEALEMSCDLLQFVQEVADGPRLSADARTAKRAARLERKTPPKAKGSL